METQVERQRRRARLVLALRLAVLVILVGGWELGVRSAWIDPFFFGQPSAIVDKLVEWSQNGTSLGPLWKQVWVTIYEAGVGFLIGAVMGIVCGIALGRNQLLSDVFSIYIKVANSIPRVVLGSIFVIALGLGHGLQGRARRGHGVLRGVRQRLPGRARGRQVPDRQRADPRRHRRGR